MLDIPDPEALNVARREMELARGVWRTPDPDEADEPHLCLVPGCENPVPMLTFPHSRTGKPLARPALRCDSCVAAGYVPSPCRCCGGRLTRREQMGSGRDRGIRGVCKACRHPVNHEDFYG